MVCGTSSGAGKSLLATALARWYSRQGLKVAPFKAQNMSNNARVVVDAYEIRHGRTLPTASPGAEFTRDLQPVLPDHGGWQYGQTLALYLHGILESPQVMRALFGQQTPTLDDTLNGLADFIDGRFAPGVLLSLLQKSEI